MSLGCSSDVPGNMVLHRCSKPTNHQPSHPLFLDSLRLLLLLPLCIGMPCGHGLGQLLDLSRYRSVILLEVFSMLEDAVKVFLKREGKGMTIKSLYCFLINLLLQTREHA